MLYSFDVFDTLITRVTYSPVGIFQIMQNKLESQQGYSGYFKHNFADLRIDAEKSARSYAKENGNCEVGINDIYYFLSYYENLNQQDIDKLIELEISIEKKCVLPINKNISLLKKIIEDGNEVILISDMYLSENVIRGILYDIDKVFEDIPIYVSSDYNVTKSTGLLYAYIHNKLNIPYRDWIHIGDNFISDYRIPTTLGIESKYVNNKIEYKWINELKLDTNALEYQFAFGLLRSLYNESDTSLSRLGKSFSGMIILAYANWILDNAIRADIEELYFIARDGYIIQKVFDRIARYKNVNIVTKYIYGSRRAWRVNEGSDEAENAKKYFVENVNFDKKIGFVDANGYGISITHMAKLLQNVWKDKIPVYYFSFHKRVSYEKCEFLNYVYSDSDIIELLCSATHASTIGYAEIDGKMNPVFERCNNNEDISEYVDGVLLYTDAFLNFANRLEININLRNVVEKLASTKRYTYRISLEELWNQLNNDKSMGEVVQKNITINKKEITAAEKVIIYGAGKAGRRIFNEYNNDEKHDILAWTDINYEEYAKQGLPVGSINAAIKDKYDYIVIAMTNKIAVRSAKCILKELGVPAERIKEIESLT